LHIAAGVAPWFLTPVVQVQYMTIQSVVSKAAKRGTQLTIECKDFRVLDFILADESVRRHSIS